MTDFYDYWLNIGEWNSKQAAFIVNDKDPELYAGRVKFPNKIKENYKVNKKEWQRKIFRDYTIFETATRDDWEKYVDKLSDDYSYALFNWRPPKVASPNAFLSLARDKQMDFSDELLEAWGKSKTAIKGNEGIEVAGALVEKESTAARNKRIFDMALDIVGKRQKESKECGKNTVATKIHQSGKFPDIDYGTIVRNFKLKEVKKALKLKCRLK